MKKDFNIVIVGTGGQGQITLLQILAEAAMREGYDVKTSELHGLAQRGGSVEVHIRFGRKIYSPLVAQAGHAYRQAGADLILGLEMQECLKASRYANPKSVFLINKLLIPILGQKLLKEEVILENLKKITRLCAYSAEVASAAKAGQGSGGQAKKLFLIPADDICGKELGNKVVAGIYLLSLACFQGLIPLKPDSILKAIKKIIPEKYLELNKKTFELAQMTPIHE